MTLFEERPGDRRGWGTSRVRTARWLPWVLLVASALLLAPLMPAMMLALWLSAAAGVLYRPLTRLLGGRPRLAAAVTVVAATALLIPFLLLLTSLAADTFQFLQQLSESQRGKQMFEQLVSPGASGRSGSSGISGLWDLVMQQQARAWAVVQQIAGTATRVVIALVVILAGTYSLLLNGGSWYRWVEAHAPFSKHALGRLKDAFYETGRGLFIGIGGAGVAQAIVATIAYLALGVPHALELGALTLVFSLIPVLGTAVVWVPVAAGLALTGRTGAAIALAICGVVVIGSIDNFVRPLLARWGRLQLPAYLVLVTMFGGVLVLGGWGLFIAPLVVRLTKEAIEVWQLGRTEAAERDTGGNERCGDPGEAVLRSSRP